MKFLGLLKGELIHVYAHYKEMPWNEGSTPRAKQLEKQPTNEDERAVENKIIP